MVAWSQIWNEELNAWKHVTNSWTDCFNSLKWIVFPISSICSRDITDLYCALWGGDTVQRKQQKVYCCSGGISFPFFFLLPTCVSRSVFNTNLWSQLEDVTSLQEQIPGCCFCSAHATVALPFSLLEPEQLQGKCKIWRTGWDTPQLHSDTPN